MHPLRHLPIASSFVVALAITSTAFAQTAAPAVPTVTPSPSCEKPGEPPNMTMTELGKAGAESKRNNWFKGMKAYLDCLKAFISDQQAAAAPHVRAANAAVEEFNKSSRTFNEQVDAAKQ